LEHKDEALAESDHDGSVPIWTQWEITKHETNSNPNFVKFQVWELGRRQPFFFKKVLDKNVGYIIPKGSYLILEAHYHGSGRPEKERTQIGFYEYKNRQGVIPIRNNPGKQWFYTTDITVPAGARDAEVSAGPGYLDKPSVLLGGGVHMHMRGISAKLIAQLPDGSERVLASMPFFNYLTGNASRVSFAAQKPFPAGTKLKIVCKYDNSAANPYNPNPREEIHWGQRLDRAEMCTGGIISIDAATISRAAAGGQK
jgi:hypothetical protein